MGGGILRKGTEAEEVRDSSGHGMKGTKEIPHLGHRHQQRPVSEGSTGLAL